MIVLINNEIILTTIRFHLKGLEIIAWKNRPGLCMHCLYALIGKGVQWLLPLAHPKHTWGEVLPTTSKPITKSWKIIFLMVWTLMCPRQACYCCNVRVGLDKPWLLARLVATILATLGWFIVEILRCHNPPRLLSNHDYMALPIIVDHIAHITDMNDGNSAFSEISYWDEVIVKLRHI